MTKKEELMGNLSNQHLITLFQLVSRIISAIVALSGIIVLIGWIFDIAILKSPHPALITMKANTALCFILIGVSLWLLQFSQKGQRGYRIPNGTPTVGLAPQGVGQLCVFESGIAKTEREIL